MKRAALGALFAIAAACFARIEQTLPAWMFVAIGIGAAFRRTTLLEPVAPLARRILYLALVATVLFGWLVMVFPVLTADALRLWTLILGYALAATGAFLILGDEHEAERPALLASAGLLAVVAFDLAAPIEGYLIAAGACGFVYLAWDALERRAHVGRYASSAAFGLAALGLGYGIVRALPWTQVQLEQTMLSVYTPTSDGVESQHRTRLGELRSMKLSKRVVLRVWSERPQRLRSRVLVRFDKTTWHRDPASLRTLEPTPRDRPLVEELPGADFLVDPALDPERRYIQTRILRVDGQGLVTPGGSVALHAPAAAVHIDSANVVSLRPGDRVRQYGVLHEVNHQRAQEGPLYEATRTQTLQLPDGLDPRISELAEEIAGGLANDEAVAERIVAYLRESYEYSLDVGDVDRDDPIADFLFAKRKGWCEYFAGSAALLLRTRGIPTRYVRGFNVIGSQRKYDHYIVREWDRHAWIEAYIEGKGWLEYDPTPAAEYESLHAGLGNDWLTELVEWARMQTAILYVSLRQLEWRTVGVDAIWVLAMLLAGVAGLRLVRAVGRRERRGNDAKEVSEPGLVTELEQLVAALDRELEKLGAPRPPSRAPLEHWDAVDGKVDAARHEAGRSVLEAYYAVRFGGRRLDDGELRELKARVTRPGTTT